MTDIFLALLPTFAVILVGAGLKRAGLPGDAFWALLDRLTYMVLFPALLVTSTARGSFPAASALPMAAALTGGILLMAGLLVLARRLMPGDGPAFSSIFQGSLRYNTYVAFAATGALAGREGMALAGLAVAAMVPLLNLLSVICVAACALPPDGEDAAPKPPLLRLVLTNPLIIACAIGIPLGVSGLGVPPVLGETLDILAAGSLPLALLAVGAGLNLKVGRGAGLGRAAGGMMIACTIKLFVMPLLALLILWPFGVDDTTRLVTVLFAACPTATSAYILARQLGGDAPLAAAIITASTLAALITMPLLLTLVLP
ncbi:AEC family transporter [Tistrella bauzanensis]|uniref:AEC family transporter n=1 Tax=Tistrella arctica TaxID=3133430 RepID=A0ABU9YJ47_9PROT